MPMWYSAGTVAVTANSATVTGTGTAFSANARVGDAFRGPDGRWYAVTNIASASVISISPAYQGDTATGQTYAIAPIQGYVKDSADRLRQITDQFGTILADLGENGPSIKVDAAGLLADRAAYDGRSAGFAYYATDTELLYIKLGGAADAWSLGAPVAVGPAGPTGDVTPEALQARDDAQAAAVAASESASTAAQVVSSVQASAQAAADSAAAAGSSAIGALASEQKAEQWAENSEDSPVEPGQFSAKHHATKAAASAASASGSATSASTSAASASSYATAASDSASAAGQFASAAAASASTASTKAGESSSSASAAAQSSQEAQQAAAAVAAIGAGWTPVLAVVADGERRVLQVTDWTGGQSNKPATGQYVGPSGLVSSIASAVNIRGAAGSGSVQTVAGVAPDANGNVALGPSNVGALAANGTAADASMLGGQPPSYYLGGGSWGAITGTLANQTDLKNALDAKVTGQAQQNTTDTTAGRLLAVGAFGLGGSAILQAGDLNALSFTQFFQTANTSTNVPVGQGTPSGQGYGIHIQHSNPAFATQRWVQLSTNRMFERVKNNGTWLAWVELYHTGNLTVTDFAKTFLDDVDGPAARTTLGAVGADSFSSSLAATGYQRLHGGLIIQWGAVSVGANTTAAVTFPIAFPNACLRVINGLEQTGTASTSWDWVPVAYNKTATGMTVTNGNSATTVVWVAFGY